MAKKYASLTSLQNLVSNIKNIFATKTEVNEKSKVQMITFGETENSTEDISTLKIHKLTREQYEEELAKGNIDESALYLTPDEGGYTQAEMDEILSNKADSSHNHLIGDITNLQSTLDDKVPTSRTINNKPLAENVTLSASDVGAAPSSHNHNNLYYTEAEIDSKLSGKSDSTHNHDTKYDTKGAASAVQGNLDVVSDALDAHTTNSDIHVTTTNKSNWNTAYNHSQAAHARVDATKVEDSTTNGNIKINGTETNVYSHPNSGVSAGTYKSVTVNAQGHITGGSNPTTLAGYGITDGETKGAASSAVSTHNTSTSAHNDIRDLISGLTTKLNNFLDVDDTTTDQLSEVLELIENNKGTLESLTTSKINVSDIVNNLTTNSTSKVLSAAQGVAIKTLIDSLQAELDGITEITSAEIKALFLA